MGARYENVQRLLGHETALEYRVTEYEAGRRVVVEGGSSSVHTRDEIEVRPLAERRTAVVYTMSIDLLGGAKVGTPLLPTTINRIADDGERQLKERLTERVG